ncbi:MAG: ATP-binding protein [Oscillospiraceae bacterium]|jgi:predicted AAA+ superfamily ATPase|nr:ATP-binding protein [Oscillospiraceae bacterium]
MIDRPLYTNRVFTESVAPSAKLLTGMKRAGKSSVMQMARDELTRRGAPKQSIIHLSFEGLENSGITESAELYDAVTKRVAAAPDAGRIYLFLDEPQRVYGWERAALHLMHDLGVYIYAAGSNSDIVSPSVLATLEDRCEIINVTTLSFTEYLIFRESFTRIEDIQRELARYIMQGGFPTLHLREHTQDEAYTHVRDIMSAAVWSDVVGSHQLRRADQLTRIIRFVFENVGRTFSAKHLSDSLKGENKEINIETVYTYLERLENAYIISRCRRYDLHAEEPLKTQEKFYLADVGLRFAMLGFSPTAIGNALENTVYLELVRRGYEVYIGKHGKREIDFVAQRGNERVYIQLGREVHPERTENDAYNTLAALRDNYPKYILSADPNASGNRNGIETASITDFLLGGGHIRV